MFNVFNTYSSLWKSLLYSIKSSTYTTPFSLKSVNKNDLPPMLKQLLYHIGSILNCSQFDTHYLSFIMR